MGLINNVSRHFFEKTFTSQCVCRFIDSPEGRWLAGMRGGAERVSTGRCLIDGFWGTRGVGGGGWRMRGEGKLDGAQLREREAIFFFFFK